jgi:hypothetical protein
VGPWCWPLEAPSVSRFFPPSLSPPSILSPLFSPPFSLRRAKDIKDCLTDLVAHSARFQDGWAHMGFLRAAELKYELLEPVILQYLRQHPLYQFVVCGHSMGAGVGAIFTLMFHQGIFFIFSTVLSPFPHPLLQLTQRFRSTATLSGALAYYLQKLRWLLLPTSSSPQ